MLLLATDIIRINHQFTVKRPDGSLSSITHYHEF